MKSRMLGAVSACVFTFTSITTAQAAPVSGQGTWETTLEGRLETAPGSGVFLAYYDTVLDITWAADANINGLGNWDNQDAWAASLTLGGVSGWRLPTVSPIDGSTFDTNFSNNATTDDGFAPTTTDGTDGGWRDGSNTPVSEMGHMYYVTLGNFGRCTPDDADPSGCTLQTGWGLTNTGPFSNVQSSGYWSGTSRNSISAWVFYYDSGEQDGENKILSNYAWAVRTGDVPLEVVPWVYSSILPSSRSVQVDVSATAFATIMNPSSATATDCSLSPVTNVPADFLYQTTDPLTNTLTGTPNTPVTIAPESSQSFMIAITPSVAFSPTDVELQYDCTNTDPAPVTVGLNTLVTVGIDHPGI